MNYYQTFAGKIDDLLDYESDALMDFNPETKLTRKLEESDASYFDRIQRIARVFRTLSEDVASILSDRHAPWTYVGDEDVVAQWCSFHGDLHDAQYNCNALCKLVDDKEYAGLAEVYKKTYDSFEKVRKSFKNVRYKRPRQRCEGY